MNRPETGLLLTLRLRERVVKEGKNCNLCVPLLLSAGTVPANLQRAAALDCLCPV